MGCSTELHPTKEFILGHSERYADWSPYKGYIPVNSDIVAMTICLALVGFIVVFFMLVRRKIFNRCFYNSNPFNNLFKRGLYTGIEDDGREEHQNIQLTRQWFSKIWKYRFFSIFPFLLSFFIFFFISMIDFCISIKLFLLFARLIVIRYQLDTSAWLRSYCIERLLEQENRINFSLYQVEIIEIRFCINCSHRRQDSHGFRDPTSHMRQSRVSNTRFTQTLEPYHNSCPTTQFSIVCFKLRPSLVSVLNCLINCSLLDDGPLSRREK